MVEVRQCVDSQRLLMRRKSRPFRLSRVLALLTSFHALAASQTVFAEGAATNFSGKTITVNIGYGPGSGNDVLGRIVATHLGRHLPGKPAVIPLNMPGAGSFKAANYMYTVAPRDGTALGYVAQTAATEELLGNPTAQFKTAEFGWLGRISPYNIVTTTWHTSNIKTIADAQQKESFVAASAPGSTVFIYPNLLNKILGTKFKIVRGYETGTDMALAVERGEVQGVSLGWFSIKQTKADWVKDKKINILTQWMAERQSDLPDVPTVVELARTSDEADVLRFYANEGEIGKAIFAPPGLPPETLATLRKGFAEMVADPDFISDAKKLQVELDPMSGEKLQAMVQATSRTPASIIKKVKEFRE
jgi:tripartite-type tricarboxylate transporter receptor subunit TctC